jgi:hypothetical protein
VNPRHRGGKGEEEMKGQSQTFSEENLTRRFEDWRLEQQSLGE